MSSLKTLLKSKSYIAHPIRLSEKSGHIITQVLINGVKGRFIIDTGASATCFDDALSIKYHINNKSETQKISTASGSLEPKIAHGIHIAIGEWSYNDMTLLCMEMQFINEALAAEKMRPIQGLLGADFLLKSKAVIDYGSMTLYMKPQQEILF